MGNFGVRTCVFCGKEFQAKSYKQNTCGDDHYSSCPDCGEPVLIKESYQNFLKYGPRRCFKCRNKSISKSIKSMTDEEKEKIQKKREENCLKKYGTKHPMQSKEVKEKVHKTVKEKYGVDNLSQSKEIQDRIKENSLEKYGVEHYSQDKDIRQRMKDRMKDKYGVEYALQNKDLFDKKTQTTLDKYGVKNVAQAFEVKEKMKQTNLEKYGVEYAAQAPEIVQRRIKTSREKYGAPALIFSDEFLSTLIQDPTKKEEYIKFKNDPKSYLLDNFDTKPSFKEVSDRIGLSNGQISDTLKHLGLQNLIQYNKSTMEVEVSQELLNIDENLIIEYDTRSIISPKEIDIYLPEYKFGIECNPTSTHNSSFPFIGEEILPPSYHQSKSILAQENDVFLFHLFGFEWESKREIILSMFRNILGKNKNKIYARNTYIDEINAKESDEFLYSYHRQGSMRASIRLGLREKETNKLVSLITFNKVRPTIGKKIDENTEGEYELSRFCSILDTTVIGGASKLFKYFIENYQPKKVISFSDFARARGSLYKTLGFEYKHLSAPGYVWVNLNTDQYYNRVVCQKKNLKKFLHDDSIDMTKTERQILEEHGYAQVFDSGVIRWEYNHI